jgi:hypothetical protein
VILLGAIAIVLPVAAALLLPWRPIMPVVSIVALMMAGLLAATSWSCREERSVDNLTIWDVAGLFAFVGFGAGMLSNSELIIELLKLR